MADKPQRDGWEKFKILSDPVGKVLTAILVAVLGYYVNRVLQREQEYHAYVDLLNQREQSDDTLRKDMFSKVIDTFVTPHQTDLNSRILDVELLAYNFHESIDLSPLLKDVYVQAKDDKRARERLHSLAEEVITRELVTLREVGCVFKKSVTFEALDKQFNSPSADTGTAGTQSGEEDPFALSTPPGCPEGKELPRRALTGKVSGDPHLDRWNPLLYVTFQSSTAGSGDMQKSADAPQYDLRDLAVSPFDFPMTHNVRLEGGGRVAIAMSRVDDLGVELSLVYFPDSRTSLRDKPFLDEVINMLETQQH